MVGFSVFSWGNKHRNGVTTLKYKSRLYERQTGRTADLPRGYNVAALSVICWPGSCIVCLLKQLCGQIEELKVLQENHLKLMRGNVFFLLKYI